MKFKPLRDRVFVKYSSEEERQQAVFTYPMQQRKTAERHSNSSRNRKGDRRWQTAAHGD